MIGTQSLVAGFGLAGARVYLADSPAQVRAAWDELPDAVAVVLLTEAAADAVGAERVAPLAPLSVVMPA